MLDRPVLMVALTIGAILLMAIIVTGRDDNTGTGKPSNPEGTRSPGPLQPLDPPEREPEPELSVSVNELNRAYQNNEARANSIYKGKRLAVRGIVSEVAEHEILGGFTVIMTQSRFMYVNCKIGGFLDRTGDSSIIHPVRLDKGDLVVAYGVGGGEVLGRPYLDDCSIHDVLNRSIH